MRHKSTYLQELLRGLHLDAPHFIRREKAEARTTKVLVKKRDPETPQEWQEAVKQAEFFLALDSALLYGLIDTDIRADVERCDEILRRGKQRGIEPRPLEQVIPQMVKRT